MATGFPLGTTKSSGAQPTRPSRCITSFSQRLSQKWKGPLCLRLCRGCTSRFFSSRYLYSHFRRYLSRVVSIGRSRRGAGHFCPARRWVEKEMSCALLFSPPIGKWTRMSTPPIDHLAFRNGPVNGKQTVPTAARTDQPSIPRIRAEGGQGQARATENIALGIVRPAVAYFNRHRDPG
jgi:hypothetical protein